jgi:hypothetical protein
MEMKRKVQYTLEDVRNIAQEAIDRATEKRAREHKDRSAAETTTLGEIASSNKKIAAG